MTWTIKELFAGCCLIGNLNLAIYRAFWVHEINQPNSAICCKYTRKGLLVRMKKKIKNKKKTYHWLQLRTHFWCIQRQPLVTSGEHPASGHARDSGATVSESGRFRNKTSLIAIAEHKLRITSKLLPQNHSVAALRVWKRAEPAGVR